MDIAKYVAELIDDLPDYLQSALAMLTDRQRQCLVLVVVDNATQEDAAKELGISQATVAWHVAAAIEHLGAIVGSDLQPLCFAG